MSLLDEPDGFAPAMVEAAGIVRDLLRDPGIAAVRLMALDPLAGAALVLAAEGFRWSTPQGKEPAEWAGAWLMTWELNAAADAAGEAAQQPADESLLVCRLPGWSDARCHPAGARARSEEAGAMSEVVCPACGARVLPAPRLSLLLDEQPHPCGIFSPENGGRKLTVPDLLTGAAGYHEHRCPDPQQEELFAAPPDRADPLRRTDIPSLEEVG